MPEALLKLEEVQLPWGWWLDLSFREGVARRVGWWEAVSSDSLCHFYVVVFKDGTRSSVITGTNPLRKKEKKK
jgi:hypothetical protein